MNTLNQSNNILKEIANNLAGFPVLDLFQKFTNTGKRLKTILTPAGLYEVLGYESTLELKDNLGEMATFWKREKVRYLQDNVIAFQDQAWGDGEILLNYRCTHGNTVEMYRPGQKTTILISTHNIRQFGDEDEFQMEWDLKNCFTRAEELWETSVDHPSQMIRMNIIFPINRPPRRVLLIESTKYMAVLGGENNLSKLLDGRWMAHWEVKNPRQHEKYIIQWDW